LPRDISSRAAKEACDLGRGVGPGGRHLSRSRRRDQRFGENTIQNAMKLFVVYEKITGENAHKADANTCGPLHMGRLWVDYDG
jgi:succinate dehydrogenase / fumarate reductase flavoprotein subunit